MEHTNAMRPDASVCLRSHDQGPTGEGGHGGPDPRRISQKALLLRGLGSISWHAGGRSWKQQQVNELCKFPPLQPQAPGVSHLGLAVGGACSQAGRAFWHPAGSC